SSKATWQLGRLEQCGGRGHCRARPASALTNETQSASPSNRTTQSIAVLECTFRVFPGVSIEEKETAMAAVADVRHVEWEPAMILRFALLLSSLPLCYGLSCYHCGVFLNAPSPQCRGAPKNISCDPDHYGCLKITADR
ncbi:hypothetical protein OSTOST_19399, partial [Ostertagia ostertagi]